MGGEAGEWGETVRPSHILGMARSPSLRLDVRVPSSAQSILTAQYLTLMLQQFESLQLKEMKGGAKVFILK